MARIRLTLSLFLALLVAPALPVQSQEPSGEGGQHVLSRLMAEPLTLFDWGLAQLERDIRASAARVLFAPEATKAGVIYDWRAKLVTLYVAHPTPAPQRTGSNCRDTFHALVTDLTAGAPASPDAAGWYLQGAFRPKGHIWGSRFEDLGAKLTEVVRLEVSLTPMSPGLATGDAGRVRCTGPLDATGRELEVEDIS